MGVEPPKNAIRSGEVSGFLGKKKTTSETSRSFSDFPMFFLRMAAFCRCIPFDGIFFLDPKEWSWKCFDQVAGVSGFPLTGEVGKIMSPWPYTTPVTKVHSFFLIIGERSLAGIRELSKTATWNPRFYFTIVDANFNMKCWSTVIHRTWTWKTYYI